MHLCSLNRRLLLHWDLVSAAVSWDFLHLEIIQERLEREYNLDLVTTAPGVIYKVHKTNGEVIELTNPSNLPDPSEIEYMEEPIVSSRDHGDDRVYRCDHGALPGAPRHLSGHGIYGGDPCASEVRRFR